MKNKNIAVATGTRADWGLLSPLVKTLAESGIMPDVLATNMHLDPKFGNTVEEIRADGFEPVMIPASGCAYEITSQVVAGFGKHFATHHYDCVVILGDRFEMLGVASAALLAGIPIVHIAGGTVSEGAFDDSIRNAITQMASLHLVETEMCGRRVRDMGRGNVVVCGALGVYNFLKGEYASKEELEEFSGMRIDSPTLLVTLHAATLSEISPLRQMKNLTRALRRLLHPEDRLKERYPYIGNLRIVFTYPNNDVDSDLMIEELESFVASSGGRAVAVKSLGRRRYIGALKVCAGVVGNSSSGIVEVPSAGIPTLDIGIRQKGRECGASVIHVEQDEESIFNGLLEILKPEIQEAARHCENPYYQDETPILMKNTIIDFLNR